MDHKLQSLIMQALAKTPCKEATIYVHGFNNDFETAASVMAQLWHFCGRAGVPIIYSWPAGSGLNLRGYNYDRESGEFTNFHLKRFLEAVAATPDWSGSIYSPTAAGPTY
ncbi:MAG: alpha/beta hydrolase [Phycisphaerales bacterium]|nr:alpha/beta hydrolase [Phycisphaerales bacterium]